MADKFSFTSADQLIQALSSAHQALKTQTDQLLRVFTVLGQSFRDDAYEELRQEMDRSHQASRDVIEELAFTIAQLCKYREALFQLANDEIHDSLGFSPVPYGGAQPRYGEQGEQLAAKNRQLAFQNEVAERVANPELPASVRKTHAKLGARCPVASQQTHGTAHYNPVTRRIHFNLEEDLQNDCGSLSTYFHEVGHWVDHNARPGRCLSDTPSFRQALEQDWDTYVQATQLRYGCDLDTAYYHIEQELMQDVDLHADVSDIIGGLTQCKCQNPWGHSPKYWKKDPTLLTKEAFANMYSSSMGSPQRIALFNRYFPTAYRKFTELLEGLL